MTVLAVIVAAVLLPVAALHMVWAVGVPWPYTTPEDLARGVGGPSFGPESRWWTKFSITSVAAGAIAVAGLLPAVYVGLLPSPIPQTWIFWLLAAQIAVFLLRGALGYVDFVPASKNEPFRTNNRRYFSPLIIALGLMCTCVLLLSVPAGPSDIVQSAG